MEERKSKFKGLSSNLKDIKNRIVEYRIVKADELEAHEKNPRKHPAYQVEAMEKLLSQIGFAGAAIAFRTKTGKLKLIDGHMRQLLSEDIPCLITDLTEDEAEFALMSYDWIGSIARTNQDKLNKLIGNRLKNRNEELEAFIKESTKNVDTFDKEGRERAGLKIRTDIDDLVFPTDNWLEIPMYDSENLLDIEPGKIIRSYAGPDSKGDYFFHKSEKISAFKISETDRKRSIVYWYTEDAAMEVFWTNPIELAKRVVGDGWMSAIPPDYSVNDLMPRIIALFNTFKARWLGCYLQACGVKILPCVNLFPDREEELCYGLPKNLPMLSFQIQNLNRTDDVLLVERTLEKTLDILKPEKLVVYGVESARKACEFIIEKNHKGPWWFVYSMVAEFRSRVDPKRARRIEKGVIASSGIGVENDGDDLSPKKQA